MKAIELRLNNIVNFAGGYILLNMPDLQIIQTLKENSGFKPIPLTEDWLLRFGFEKCPYKKRPQYSDYRLGTMVISPVKDFTLWEVEYTSSKHIQNRTWIATYQHVHQLQNLYFALTGEELEINKQ